MSGIDEIDDLLEKRAKAISEMAYNKARYNLPDLSRLKVNKALYFVRCGDAVKIGVSVDPNVRLEALQTGAPGKLTLMAVIPKAGPRENECHQRLEHLRIHGEWFRYGFEIDALIKELSC